MAIKQYSVTLDEAIVEDARVKYEKHGSKLSPLLNQLLKEWLEGEQ